MYNLTASQGVPAAVWVIYVVVLIGLFGMSIAFKGAVQF